MGDPKRLKKKYFTPSHPWQKARIDEEKVLMSEYGLKNKQELWKLGSKLKKIKTLLKVLIPKKDAQAELEKKQMRERLESLNLISKGDKLEDILSLSLKDICERRLQTIVLKKGIAKSISQARQFVVHEHIVVGDKKITSPSYLVTAKEEPMVRFAENSALSDPEHPERIQEVPVEVKPVEKKPTEKPKKKVSKPKDGAAKKASKPAAADKDSKKPKEEKKK